MPGLGGSGGSWSPAVSGGTEGVVDPYTLMAYGRRMRLAETMAGDLFQDPGVITGAIELARSAPDDYTFEQQIGEMYGFANAGKIAADLVSLNESNPDLARAQFDQLPESMQVRVQRHGFQPTPYGELKKGGDGQPSGIGRFLPVVGGIVGAITGGVGEEILAPTARGFNSLFENTTHLYRAMKTADVEEGGLASWNPSNWEKYWDISSSGKTYVLDDDRENLKGQYNLSDSELDLFLKLSTGKLPGVIAEEEGLTQGTPDHSQRVLQLYDLMASDLGQELIGNPLDGGDGMLNNYRVSFGRTIARGIGFDPADLDNGWGRRVSGAGDMFYNLAMDPTLLLGRAGKTVSIVARVAHSVDAVQTTNAAARAVMALRAGGRKVTGSQSGLHLGLRTRDVYSKSGELVAHTTEGMLNQGERYLRGLEMAAKTFEQGVDAATLDRRRMELFTAMPTITNSWTDLARASTELAQRTPTDVYSESGELLARGGGFSNVENLMDFFETTAGQRMLISDTIGGANTAEWARLPEIGMGRLAAIKTKKIWTKSLDTANDWDEMLREGIGLAPSRSGQIARSLLPLTKETRLNPVRTAARGVLAPAKFLRGLTTHVPRDPVLRIFDPEGEMTAEFIRAVQQGRLVGMTTKEIDTHVGNFLGRTFQPDVIDDGLHGWVGQSAAQRAAAIIGFNKDLLSRMGIDEASDLYRRFVLNSERAYGLTDTGQEIGYAVLGSQQAAGIFVPSVREIMKASSRYSVTRALFGRGGLASPAFMDGLVGRFWKPAVLMRIGFITRAAGEELLGYLARFGVRDYVGMQLGLSGRRRQMYKEWLENPNFQPNAQWIEEQLLNSPDEWAQRVAYASGEVDTVIPPYRMIASGSSQLLAPLTATIHIADRLVSNVLFARYANDLDKAPEYVGRWIDRMREIDAKMLERSIRFADWNEGATKFINRGVERGTRAMGLRTLARGLDSVLDPIKVRYMADHRTLAEIAEHPGIPSKRTLAKVLAHVDDKQWGHLGEFLSHPAVRRANLERLGGETFLGQGEGGRGNKLPHSEHQAFSQTDRNGNVQVKLMHAEGNEHVVIDRPDGTLNVQDLFDFQMGYLSNARLLYDERRGLAAAIQASLPSYIPESALTRIAGVLDEHGLGALDDLPLERARSLAREIRGLGPELQEMLYVGLKNGDGRTAAQRVAVQYKEKAVKEGILTPLEIDTKTKVIAVWGDLDELEQFALINPKLQIDNMHTDGLRLPVDLRREVDASNKTPQALRQNQGWIGFSDNLTVPLQEGMIPAYVIAADAPTAGWALHGLTKDADPQLYAAFVADMRLRLGVHEMPERLADVIAEEIFGSTSTPLGTMNDIWQKAGRDTMPISVLASSNDVLMDEVRNALEQLTNRRFHLQRINVDEDSLRMAGIPAGSGSGIVPLDQFDWMTSTFRGKKAREMQERAYDARAKASEVEAADPELAGELRKAAKGLEDEIPKGRVPGAGEQITEDYQKALLWRTEMTDINNATDLRDGARKYLVKAPVSRRATGDDLSTPGTEASIHHRELGPGEPEIEIGFRHETRLYVSHDRDGQTIMDLIRDLPANEQGKVRVFGWQRQADGEPIHWSTEDFPFSANGGLMTAPNEPLYWWFADVFADDRILTDLEGFIDEMGAARRFAADGDALSTFGDEVEWLVRGLPFEHTELAEVEDWVGAWSSEHLVGKYEDELRRLSASDVRPLEPDEITERMREISARLGIDPEDLRFKSVEDVFSTSVADLPTLTANEQVLLNGLSYAADNHALLPIMGELGMPYSPLVDAQGVPTLNLILHDQDLLDAIDDHIVDWARAAEDLRMAEVQEVAGEALYDLGLARDAIKKFMADPTYQAAKARILEDERKIIEVIGPTARRADQLLIEGRQRAILPMRDWVDEDELKHIADGIGEWNADTVDLLYARAINASTDPDQVRRLGLARQMGAGRSAEAVARRKDTIDDLTELIPGWRGSEGWDRVGTEEWFGIKGTWEPSAERNMRRVLSAGVSPGEKTGMIADSQTREAIRYFTNAESGTAGEIRPLYEVLTTLAYEGHKGLDLDLVSSLSIRDMPLRTISKNYVSSEVFGWDRITNFWFDEVAGKAISSIVRTPLFARNYLKARELAEAHIDYFSDPLLVARVEAILSDNKVGGRAVTPHVDLTLKDLDEMIRLEQNGMASLPRVTSPVGWGEKLTPEGARFYQNEGQLDDLLDAWRSEGIDVDGMMAAAEEKGRDALDGLTGLNIPHSSVVDSRTNDVVKLSQPGTSIVEANDQIRMTLWGQDVPRKQHIRKALKAGESKIKAAGRKAYMTHYDEAVKAGRMDPDGAAKAKYQAEADERAKIVKEASDEVAALRARGELLQTDPVEMERYNEALAKSGQPHPFSEPDVMMRDFSAEEINDLRRYATAKIQHLDNLTDAALQRALHGTIPFIDDHRIRSQFQEYVGNLIPFWFAEEQFLKRWARILKESPEAFRKGQLTMHGLRSMGVIKVDSDGNEYFNYPGSAAATSFLAETGVVKLIFGKDTALPVGLTLTGDVKSTLPGFGDQVGVPSMGPMVGVALEFLGSRSPEFAKIQQNLMGPRGSNRPIMSYITPTSISRAWSAIQMNHDEGEIASALLQTAQLMEASGQGLKPDATTREKQEYLDLVEGNARTVLIVRAIAGFAAPASPTISVELPLAEEFQMLLRSGLDYAQALEAFSAKHEGDISPFTVFKSDVPSNAPISATHEALVAMDDWSEMLRNYPMAAPWILLPFQDPTKDEFDSRAYRWQIRYDLRKTRTLEEYVDALAWADASTEYFDRVDDFDSMIEMYRLIEDDENVRTTTLAKAAWQQGFKESHPIFSDKLESADGRIERDQILDEAFEMIELAEVSEEPRVVPMREMLQQYRDYTDALEGLNKSRSRKSMELKELLEMQFQGWLILHLADHPELRYFYDRVLRPNLRWRPEILNEVA